MAVLVPADRTELWARIMSDSSRDGVPLPLLKLQLRAAIDAADAWVDANASSYNLALPAAARTALTAKQKAQVLSYVIERRFHVS